MKKLSNTEAELKRNVAYKKKACISQKMVTFIVKPYIAHLNRSPSLIGSTTGPPK